MLNPKRFDLKRFDLKRFDLKGFDRIKRFDLKRFDFIVITCIIPPPILLVLYPTKFLKKCIGCLGFQRWDVLHHIINVFQGCYKDGTEGTVDYRLLSAFFLILQIAHGGKMVANTLLDDKNGTCIHANI